LKFWFAYIYPYQSYFEIENLTYVKNKINNEFELYVSKIYEDLARESMWENIQLQEKAKNIKWNNNNREEYFILFSKSGFSEELEELAQKEKNIILKKLI